jgi:RNA-directed DNA polymerase
MAEMRERLAAFGLTLHGEKTRLIRFGRVAALNRKDRGESKPETFNFLGFTHICWRSLGGGFLLLRRTRRDRIRQRLLAIRQGMRRRMHTTLEEQGDWLRQVMTGFFAYHAVPTNADALRAFRYHVIKLWRRTLWRRSQKDPMSWQRIETLAERWLPRPHISHPRPSTRFAVKHPRWEPYAGNPPVRFCAGRAR